MPRYRITEKGRRILILEKALEQSMNTDNIDDRTALKDGEYHPVVDLAVDYLQKLPYQDLLIWQESFASNAIEGNRLAEICLGTLNRLLDKKPVGERYLLGLAFMIIKHKDSG